METGSWLEPTAILVYCNW